MSKKEVRLHQSPIYQTLLEKLPSEFIEGEEDTRIINVKQLAIALDVANFTCWRWLSGITFSKKAVNKLVDLSANTTEKEKKGAIKAEDLFPFMLNS